MEAGEWKMQMERGNLLENGWREGGWGIPRVLQSRATLWHVKKPEKKKGLTTYSIGKQPGAQDSMSSTLKNGRSVTERGKQAQRDEGGCQSGPGRQRLHPKICHR